MSELVVITGASRGIGRATALALAGRDVELALVGRASGALSQTRSQCEQANVRVHVCECDLGDVHQVEAASAQILTLGVPAALINNAACVERAALEELTLESYHRQMDTNLLAPIWLVRSLLPAMRQAGKGRIVNVASISSTLGTARQAVYGASKWALLGFTKSLAEELSGSGLMAVAVLPGSVDTRMLQGSSFLPRMAAQDVAATLVHYALDAPLAHNGASIEMFGV